VLEFIKHFPDMHVVAQGSTPARTRLYQMAISENLTEIENILEVRGLVDEDWEAFRKGVNYNAFLVRRKT
jgi:hypothetical protein